MFADIVLPKNNENEFARIAEKLGYQKLYFLYELNDYISLQKRADFEQIKKIIGIDAGILANIKNLNSASSQSKIIAAKSSDNDRPLIETKKIKLIYGFEEILKRDSMHQRASSLNHILCDIARKNNTAIGFSYSSLFDNNIQAASLFMGRMMQNIKICQKYKVKTMIGSFSSNPYDLRAPHDIMSLFSLLGMDGKTVKESTSMRL